MEAQHIIDRIIFTYFVCEKGFVSVKGYGPISGKQLFSDILSKSNTWNYLKKLFFEQFAQENSENLDCGKNVLLEVKYLNGGLFREKELGDSKIKEGSLEINYDWNEIFDLLTNYTWIIEDKLPDLEIDEDEEKIEYHGNLTPEIIGHIYEKFVISLDELNDIDMDKLKTTKSGELKKGNKKIGAYYTPEDITDYISRNTINPHLFNNLQLEEIDFESFLDSADEETLKKALNTLDEIKICDPAAGSGAFLIKAGEVLLEYKSKIINRLNNGHINFYYLKKDIIINNLYGVDIQEGAIEICKLRLWLWLISSAKGNNVEPLPNIEYNFLIGNSLIGWTDEELKQSLLFNIDEKVIWILDTLKIGYDSKQRKIIDKAISLLMQKDMDSFAEAFYSLKSLYSYSRGDKAEILKNTLERIRLLIYTELNRIFQYDTKLNIEGIDSLDLIHWRIEFKEIFDKGGFDVIIGNPPYIKIQSLKKTNPIEVEYYKNKYYSASSGNYDIYVIFIEKALNLLNPNGFAGLILPHRFFKTEYGNNIRNLIIETKSLKKIIDFDGFMVFDKVSINTCILILDKHPSDNFIFGQFLSNKPNQELRQLLNNECDCEDLKIGTIKLSKLSNDPWVFVWGYERSIWKKLDSMKMRLEDFTLKIFQGLKTGSDSIYVGEIVHEGELTSIMKFGKNEFEIENNVLYPLVKGGNIKRFNLIEPDLRVIFPYKNGILLSPEDMESNSPLTWNYLLQHKEKLENRENGKMCVDGWYAYTRTQALSNVNSTKILTPEYYANASYAFDETGMHFFFGGGAGGYGIILKEKIDYHFVLGVLNSSLIDWYLKKISMRAYQTAFLYIKKYIKLLPIYDIDFENTFETKLHDEIVELVKGVVRLNQSVLDSNSDLEHLKSEIIHYENQINKKIYELYGLNDDEIQIIESTIKDC